MAENMKVTVKDYSKAAQQKMDRALVQALKNYGENWKKIAQRIITEKDIIDTRHLYNNTDYKLDTSNKKITTGTFNTPYAQYQELGTWKMAARPYLVPSLEEANGALVQIISQEVGDELSSTQGLTPEIYEL